MIFKEWYGAYYNTIAKILDIAVKRPVSKEEIRKIINDQAFSESILAIEPSLSEGKWQLLKKDGTTPIRHVPTIPLTDVQKHWLKAISLDPRIKLFDIEVPDVEPLFTPDDIYIFDQYTDGDPYESEDYRRNFRIILDAIHNGQPLEITLQTRSGKHQQIYATPERLEYSEKDNKFRLMVSANPYGPIINLGNILSCQPQPVQHTATPDKCKPQTFDTSARNSVVLELLDERNTVTRVMMHFAHFEKEAERIDEKHYKIKIKYNQFDETELLIRILSFGPFVKVIEPQSFVDKIKERLSLQKELLR